jgi:hypothetical protein
MVANSLGFKVEPVVGMSRTHAVGIQTTVAYGRSGAIANNIATNAADGNG